MLDIFDMMHEVAQENVTYVKLNFMEEIKNHFLLSSDSYES